MGVESEGLRPTSVMIVDDQRYARLGLALMIRKAPDLRVVAEAGDGQEALEVLEELNRSTGLPAVVLMDVRMPGMDGISATRAMARRFPTVKVLVLTTYDEDDYAFGALEVGASGFLLKDVRAAQLAQAVRAVAQGDAVLTPRVTKELIARGVPRALSGAQRKGLRVVPLVGPSSILLAVMASGFNGQRFAFHGYLPIEADRRTRRIKELEARIYAEDETQLFIETPYRNERLLEELVRTCRPSTRLCVAANVTCADEFIRTRPVKEWAHKAPDLSHRPTIFALYK